MNIEKNKSQRQRVFISSFFFTFLSTQRIKGVRKDNKEINSNLYSRFQCVDFKKFVSTWQLLLNLIFSKHWSRSGDFQLSNFSFFFWHKRLFYRMNKKLHGQRKFSLVFFIPIKFRYSHNCQLSICIEITMNIMEKYL
jgi:hypothetical protein